MTGIMQIRDRRTERRFFVDNAIIRGYGPDLGPYGIATYCALCMHADINSQECYPSHETLAVEIGSSAATVKKMLQLLESLELIAVEPRMDPETGAQTSNLYTLLNVPPRLRAAPGQDVTPVTTDTRPQYTEIATNNPHSEQSPPSDDDASASSPIGETDDGKDTKVREPSPLQRQQYAAHRAVREHFERETQLTCPERGNDKALGKLWWNPIRDICQLADYDIKRAMGFVTTAVQQMDADGLTISNPNSILKKVLSIDAKRKRGAKGPPGEQIPQQEAW